MTEYWHFISEDQKTRWAVGKTRRVIKPGLTLKVNCEPVLCEQGLHASKRAIDALGYAPGPIICRVTLGGKIVHDTDKSVATERTVLWMADATEVLNEFALREAARALKRAKVTDERCWNVLKVKRDWMAGRATDKELAPARAAAWAAARAAAGAAAGAAARAAAGAAAGAAAWDAAWGAARAAANRRLTKVLKSLEPK